MRVLLLAVAVAALTGAEAKTKYPTTKFPTARPTKAPTGFPSRAPTFATYPVGGDSNVWNTAGTYSDIDIVPGEMVAFRFNKAHNVYAFASKAAFDACDFAGSTKVWTRSSSSSKTFAKAFGTNVQAGINGVHYLGCKKTGHCAAGMKVAVFVGPRPVDGKWGDWTMCDRVCGGGSQSRFCLGPVLGGAACAGDASRACNAQACLDGGWTDWGACSSACAGGTQARTCTAPAPIQNRNPSTNRMTSTAVHCQVCR